MYAGAQNELIREIICSRGNLNGELGLGDANNRGVALSQMGNALPFISLGTGQTASALALGESHTCALLDGGIKCWGYALSRSSSTCIHLSAAGCHKCELVLLRLTKIESQLRRLRGAGSRRCDQPRRRFQ